MSLLNDLSKDEVELLMRVKGSNLHYYKAMLKAAEIMPKRREKYSGTGDPFTNFYMVKEMLQTWFGKRVVLTTRDIFAFYNCLKFSRYLVSGDMDFEDETALDTRRDGANYYLLDLGEMLKEENG